eukprot:33607_1
MDEKDKLINALKNKIKQLEIIYNCIETGYDGIKTGYDGMGTAYCCIEIRHGAIEIIFANLKTGYGCIGVAFNCRDSDVEIKYNKTIYFVCVFLLLLFLCLDYILSYLSVLKKKK